MTQQTNTQGAGQRPPQQQNRAPALQPPPPDPMKIIEEMLLSRVKDIEAALPPMLKPQAKDFIRLALVDLPRQRSLLDVAARAPARILIALMDIARMGLFPGSKLGEAYVVPFKNKGAWDCQAIIGYRGFLKLARRSGEIADIRARVVAEGDKFDIEFGTVERIIHRPSLDTDRGDPDLMIGIYVVCEFKGGGHHVEWMSRAEIWELAKRSATFSAAEGKHLTGPWVTDYVEMAKKTVARRGSKWWPLTVDAAEAIGRDEEREIVIDAESRPAGEVLGIEGGGFKIFDTNRFAEPEPDPVTAQQQAPAPQQAQPAATDAAPGPATARHAYDTTPPDKMRRAQTSGARKSAAPAQEAQPGTPPPMTPEEIAEIHRREADEARGHGD